MRFESIKVSATKIFWFFKDNLFALIVGLAISIVCVIGIQKACDRRAERIEDAKIKAYEAELAEKLKVFQNYIDLANRDHETTTAILDAMAAMTKNINTLAENDVRISARVDEIRTGEYAVARTQKNDQAAIKQGRAKSKKPITTREVEALRVDEELYPSN